MHYIMVWEQNLLKNLLILSNLNQQLRLNEENVNLIDNINCWLSIVSSNTSITYERDVKQNEFNPYYNGILPTETAYGLSFTLPIITALLYSEINNQILLIENPEAHLHPAAQSKLGELIALAANSGKQVIVETHSDHIINGIRIAAQNKKIKSDDVKFYFLKRDSFDVETSIEIPKLLPDGKLNCWPNGFFDQNLKDKAALIRNS